MFPNMITVVIFICIAILIVIIGMLLPKKVGDSFEIIASIIVLIYLFYQFSFGQGMILMSLAAITYANIGELVERGKRKKRNLLIEKVRESNAERIMQKKELKRMMLDLILTACVSVGAFIFLIYAPEIYSTLKLFICYGLITVFAQMIERLGNFARTKLYWDAEDERLIIISLFQSRDIPMCDVKAVEGESAPDILKLHPLFTFLSANQDYTCSFQPTIKLSFPGENIYLAPNEVEKWERLFLRYATKDQEEQQRKVLSFWHPTNVKRVFWKGYFAITVKGISAYTGLLFLLIWLDLPSYLMVTCIIIWWLFNLYVSDRVLIAGTDAEQIREGALYKRAKKLFNRAGIPGTKLYLIDSPIHNGLATGMNLGRGTIMLTKATTELSIEAVEAILAHEAVHIKKRDVLISQIARILFLGFMALGVYIAHDQLVILSENLLLFIPLIYSIIILYPMFLSFVAQWTEMRADHFGAKLLRGGREQMRNGLRELGEAQDQALKKSLEYSQVSRQVEDVGSCERDKWFFRCIEFQFQAHPPLYFRIASLSKNISWQAARKGWIRGRVGESIPSLLKRKKSA